MRLIAGSGERSPVIASAVIMGAVAALCVAILANAPVIKIAPFVALTVAAALTARSLLRWKTLLSALILIIVFIPIRRYTVPFNLPFQLEPYRLLVVFIALGWLASLLADPRVRPRRSGLEPPLALLVIASLGSVLANTGRIHELGVDAEVMKTLTFLASFFLVFYFVVSVVSTERDIDSLVKVLVGGMAVVGLLCVVEARTSYNVFDHLDSFIPGLRFTDYMHTDQSLAREGRLRSFGSSQHPIAMGAALVMVIPLAIYLVRKTRQRRWKFALALLALGAMATGSRTAIVMIVVIGWSYLRLRPVETKRLWPLLIPTMLVAHFMLPGTLGTIKDSFFPKHGLIAEQQQGAGTYGSGRIADLGPGMKEFAQRPLLGQGLGSRIVDGPFPNAPILDDQWLETLLETGAVGTFAWIWLFSRFVRRLKREAKEDDSDRAWLLGGIAASVTAFAIGLALYDAFSFIQVTILFFILLGIGSAALGPRAKRRSA